MTAAKKKMSPLQIILILHTLLSYLSLITTLPITSKPLENNPEHLTWEAWLMIDSKNPHEKTRKITPKSIFITPNLTNTTASVTCPDGYKIDHNNQCIQVVNIDPDDELLNHLESLLGPSEGHEGDVSYDYSDYDSTAVHAGPFQLNIPLNLGLNIGDSDSDDNFKGDFDYDDRESDNSGPQPGENDKPFRDPAENNPNPNDKLSVVPISPDRQTTSTTTNRISDVTNTEAATTTDAAPETETISSLFEQNQNSNNTEKNVDEDASAIEMIDNHGTDDNVRMEPLKQGNENIAAELQKESFLFDVNDTTTTTKTTAQQATTLMVADDDGFTTEQSTPNETANEFRTTVKNVIKKSPTTTTTQKSSTKEAVVVVTPSNRDTLKIQNESNMDKILREKSEKHEQKEDAIDSIDTRNRFVYNHLGNEAPTFHLKTTTELPLWASLLQSSTTTDKTVLEKKINEQVKHISEIIKENSRKKTTASESSTTAHNDQIDKRPNNFVRFPGPTSQRLMAPTINTTPPTNAESDGKWWLSSNWPEVESNYDRLQQQHQPTPASSAASLSSTPFWKISSNRGNSKSPTEHLYEEQRFNHDPIYRVLNSKSLQHHHNNR